jgi:hypothetical protein
LRHFCPPLSTYINKYGLRFFYETGGVLSPTDYIYKLRGKERVEYNQEAKKEMEKISQIT